MDFTHLLYQLALILGAGFLIVIGYALARYGLSYLKLKVGDEKYNQLMKLAETAVKAIQQMGSNLGLTNERKLEMAKEAIDVICAKLKLDLTDAEKEQVIEAIVYLLKLENGTGYLPDEPKG